MQSISRYMGSLSDGCGWYVGRCGVVARYTFLLCVLRALGVVFFRKVICDEYS